jgi:hypothetical protein
MLLYLLIVNSLSASVAVPSLHGMFARLWHSGCSWFTVPCCVVVATAPWLFARYLRALSDNQCRFGGDDGEHPDARKVSSDLRDAVPVDCDEVPLLMQHV